MVHPVAETHPVRRGALGDRRFAEILADFHEAGEFPYGKKQLAKTGWFHVRSRVPGDPDPDLVCLFDGRLLYPYMLRGKCRYAAARIIYEGGIDPAYFERHPSAQAKFKKALVHGEQYPHPAYDTTHSLQ